MTAATGFTALYRRRLSVSLSQPAALAGQVLTPVLWVLVVGPALTRAFGGFTHQVNYTSYVSLGQVVFILPFSAMFAGLTSSPSSSAWRWPAARTSPPPRPGC